MLIKNHANDWVRGSMGVPVYHTVRVRVALNRRRRVHPWGRDCGV